MPDLKTRFTVKAGGQLAELFSVFERKDGDLIISIKRNGFAEAATEPFPAIRQQRFSVHRSPDSTGHTVTFTLELADGTRQRGHRVVEGKGAEFRVLLASQRPAKLDDPVFRAACRDGDAVLSLAEFEPRHNTLIFHVFVGGPGALDPLNNQRGWNMQIARFGHFDVAAEWSFIPLPSLGQGDSMTMLDAGRVGPLTPAEAYNQKCDPDTHLSDRLIERYERILAKAGDSDPAGRQDLAERAHLRSRLPFPP